MTGNRQFMYIESRGQPRLHTLRANPFRTRFAASHFLPYQRHRSPVRQSKGAHAERMKQVGTQITTNILNPL